MKEKDITQKVLEDNNDIFADIVNVLLFDGKSEVQENELVNTTVYSQYKAEDGKVHDQYRIEYLRKHIEQIQLAITDGAEMMGYCPWSAIDLISTHEGMVKRYGFIYVDRDEFDLKTLDRYRKDSFYWYKKVISSNGEDLTD